MKELMNNPSIPDSIKQSLNLRYYFYQKTGTTNSLWIASLSKGTFEFENSKILISNTAKGINYIFLNHHYDRTKYKRGDFTTYTGTIDIYDSSRTKISTIVYNFGNAVKVITTNSPDVPSA